MTGEFNAWWTVQQTQTHRFLPSIHVCGSDQLVSRWIRNTLNNLHARCRTFGAKPPHEKRYGRLLRKQEFGYFSLFLYPFCCAERARADTTQPFPIEKEREKRWLPFSLWLFVGFYTIADRRRLDFPATFSSWFFKQRRRLFGSLSWKSSSACREAGSYFYRSPNPSLVDDVTVNQ